MTSKLLDSMNSVTHYYSNSPIFESTFAGFLAFIIIKVFLLSSFLSIFLSLALSYFLFTQQVLKIVPKNIERSKIQVDVHPAKYKFFQVFLISMLVLNFILAILFINDTSLLFFVFPFIIVGILSGLIALPFYIGQSVANQNYILLNLSKNIEDQQRKLKSIQESAIVKTVQTKAEPVVTPESKAIEQKKNILKTQQKQDQDTTQKQKQKQKQPVPKFDPITGKKLIEDTVARPPVYKMRFNPLTGERIVTETPEKTKPVLAVHSTTDEQQQKTSSSTITILSNIKQNLGGYVLLGSILFIIMASIAWLLILFPDTSVDLSGTQLIIAGDVFALFAILIIISSELVLKKAKYGDVVPLSYLGIGVGLGIGMLGILIMRFKALPSFLPALNLINENTEFFFLTFFFGAISWIYSWRSPYKDFNLVTLAVGLILSDYSLKFTFVVEQQYLLMFLVGLGFILLPGIQAAFSSVTDMRFLLGSLVTYFLLFLGTNNTLALINLENFIFPFFLIIPAVIVTMFLTFKENSSISNFFLILLLVMGYLPVIINEIAFMNGYINLTYFAVPIVLIYPLVLTPFIKTKNPFHLFAVLLLNGLTLNAHSTLIMLGRLSVDSWFVILVPLLINSLALVYLFTKDSLPELLLSIYLGTFILSGYYITFEYFAGFLLLISLVFTVLSFHVKTQHYWDRTVYFLSTFVFISLGSFYVYLDSFLLTSFIILVLGFIALNYFLKKEDQFQANFMVIIGTMIIFVFLSLIQPSQAPLLIILFSVLVIISYSIILITKSYTDETFYILVIIIVTFNGLLVYNEYQNVILIVSLSFLSILSLYFYIHAVGPKLENAKKKQNIYDLTIFLSSFSIFLSLVMLEEYNPFNFHLVLAVLLVLNLVVIFRVFRYPGFDITLSILIPAILYMAKELYVHQYLEDVNIIYSVLGFVFVSIHAFLLPYLSKEKPVKSIISPKITAIFSVELVLLVLFVNKLITDEIAIFFFVLIIILITIQFLTSKSYVGQFDMLLIQLSTSLLAILIPVNADLNYLMLLLVIVLIPLLWLVFQVKHELHYAFNGLILAVILITDYILVLKLPNQFLVVSGTYMFLLLAILAFVLFLLKYRTTKNEDYFFNVLVPQLPILGLLALLIDLSSGYNLFWSKVVPGGINSSDNLMYATLLLFAGLVIISFNFIKGFETSFNKKIENIIIALTAEITLVIFLIQFLLNQLITDFIIQGYAILSILTFFVFLSAIGIRKDKRMIDNNVQLIILIGYILLTVTIYLLSQGLLPSYLAILGTFLIILTIDARFRSEFVYIGATLIIYNVLLLVFDIVYNFDRLIIDIAISSSITAVCFLVLGILLNNQKYRKALDIESSSLEGDIT